LYTIETTNVIISRIKRYFNSVFKYFGGDNDSQEKETISDSIFNKYQQIMASVSSTNTSICGIDVGSENCYVAVARAGGIEILLNEYSQRSTPAYIAFGGNQRELGVSAKQKQMMNLQNTCYAPSLIVGKKFSDLNLKNIPNRISEENGQVIITVNHDGQERKFTPTQLMAMLFTKLRQISGNVIDCVFNCPNYFTEPEKRALIDAATISGLNPLKVIPDMTAVALYYGFYRANNSQDSSVVVFVDCGQTSTQTSIVLFNHKENVLRVLDSEYQPNIGGKLFDELLADHFIQQKNLKLNNRARYRLIAECEKLKKQMSANSNELPINIECLYDDRDFSARIDRKTFEDLSAHLLVEIKKMLSLAFQRASEKYEKDFAEKFGKFKVDSVEIVGGTSRIPAIKQMIREIFSIEPSTTLNADEAVARGCALQCAILSPTFKIAKELHIQDALAYQINFKYRQFDAPEFKKSQLLYPRGHQFPFTKQISLTISSLPLVVAFDYVANDGSLVELSAFEIKNPPNIDVSEILQKNQIKLKVRVDANGLVSVYSSSVSYEKPEVTNEAMDQSQPEEKMETDDNNSEQPAQAQDSNAANAEPKRKSKPKMEGIDLIVETKFIAGKLAKEDVQLFIEEECNLILADKNWKEKTDAKNALEEFIYEWRDRIQNEGYDPFINPLDKPKFVEQLEINEKWLYEQDELEKMHSKSVYDERTNSMANAYGNKILNRRREFENRPRFLEQLGQRLQQANKLMKKSEPEEKDEVEKFIKEINEKFVWFEDVQGKFNNSCTYDDPPFTCDEIGQKTKEVEAAITRLHNSRTRRAEQKRKEMEDAAKAKAEAKAAEAKPEKTAEANAGESNETNGQMEVDPQTEASS
ncbi:Heat shock 70 kDa protein 4L, partial [Blomia tropicalis]